MVDIPVRGSKANVFNLILELDTLHLVGFSSQLVDFHHLDNFSYNLIYTYFERTSTSKPFGLKWGSRRLSHQPNTVRGGSLARTVASDGRCRQVGKLRDSVGGGISGASRLVKLMSFIMLYVCLGLFQKLKGVMYLANRCKHGDSLEI